MYDELNKLYEQEKIRLQAINDDKGDYLHPVFGDGKISNNSKHRIVFIGEAPGKEEAAVGKPFVGKAGIQLDEMLNNANIDRSGLFVTNSVKFRPWNKKISKNGRETVSNRTPTQNEIIDSSVLLQKELMIIKPDIVVTLGNSPLKSVLWITGCSNVKTIGDCHGQALNIGADFVLFPLYHPASGIYNHSLVDIMKHDLLMLSDYIN